jgi:type III restriction enzyme
LAPSLFVPQLALRIGDQRTLFEPEELDYFSWDLDQCNAALTTSEVPDDLAVGTAATIDLEGERLVSASAGEVRLRQLELIGEGDDWTEVELARWLDKELHRDDTFFGLAKSESQPWMHRVVDELLRGRGLSLPLVVRRRHELSQLLRVRVSDYGRSQARSAAQRLIQEQPDAVEASPALRFEMSDSEYGPFETFDRHEFRNHAFGIVARMNGEEAQCAARIDRHSNVKRWVRNPDRETQGGFWLPKSPGKFFPDFIVELMDGTIVLIEYKMGKMSFEPEERHKRAIGELWAARSLGKCRFGYVIDKDWSEIERVLAS